MRRFKAGLDSEEILERHLDGVTDLAQMYDSVLLPQWQAINAAGTIILVNNNTRFWYQQKLKREIKEVEIHFRTTTAGVGITWAELGVFTAVFTDSRTPFNFRLLGWTSVATELGTIGNYKKKIQLGPNKEGMDIWLGLGSSFVTTAPRVRSTYGDELGFGYHQQATGRPSVTSPLVGSLAPAADTIPWMPYRITR